MKRLTILMLVAMIPFFTMAQKRSKKNKDKTIEKTQATYEFMVITGYELVNNSSGNMRSADEMREIMMEPRAKIFFDFGGITTADVEKLSSQQFKSMSHAVNGSTKFGWEFINASVLSTEETKVHYYYMKRKK